MNKKLRLTLILLITAAVITLGIWAFSTWTEHYSTTSRSNSYSAKERLFKNRTLDQVIHAKTDDYDALTTVTVVDSAYVAFGETRTTYNVSVYVVDEEALTASEHTLDALQGADPAYAAGAVGSGIMTKAATAVIRMDDETGSIISFTMEALM